MGRVLTNNFSLSYAVQAAFDDFTTVAGDWKLTEPNEVANFGPTITTVARNPISRLRGARKGTITDLDAAVEFTADLTLDSYVDFIEGFMFSVGENVDIRSIATAAINATSNYTVPAISAPALAKLQQSSDLASLVFARGFSEDANNGLKQLGVGSTTTSIVVTDTLTDETVTADTQLATVEVAGLKLLDAGTMVSTWTWNAGTKQGTLTFTTGAIDPTSLGLAVGMFVHIGSPDGAGGVANALNDSVDSDTFGYGRIVSFGDTPDTIVLDKVDSTLQNGATNGAGSEDLDILFGLYIRNVAVDDDAYQEKIFLFEGAWPNLFEGDGGGDDGFEYLLNSYCNQFSWSLPLSDKSTATFAFVSTDAEPPVVNSSRRDGAATPLDPVMTTALNTSSNITRLRVTDVDETGLTTDFKSTTITINNNVSPEKVLGVLGARYVNVGNLAVTIEGNILFTDPNVIARIRSNATVTMDFIVATDDGAIITDIPAMTLGGGNRELPVNETVQVALTGEAFLDPITGIVVSTTIFPIVP